MRFDGIFGRARAALCGAVLALASCDDSNLIALPESAQVGRVAVVANRGDRSLTLIPFADSVGARTLPLGPAGEPAGLAVRGDRAVVPLGAQGVAVVNLHTGVVERVVGLAGGLAARSAVFVSDTLVAVVSPGAGAVFLFNPTRGTPPRAVTTGGSPEVVQEAGGRLFVLSPTMTGGPAPGYVMVLDSAMVPAVVELGASNPRAVAVRGGFLYVLNAGDPGLANGSVSVVNLATRRETALLHGFGESPEAMVLSPRGELYVAVPTRGVLVYNLAGAFVRDMNTPINAANVAPASRVAMDPAGFMYMLHRGSCTAPGLLVRLDANGNPASSARTGVCPVAVEFTSLPLR